MMKTTMITTNKGTPTTRKTGQFNKKTFAGRMAAVVVTFSLALIIPVMASQSDYGAAGALADTSYTLEEMMTYAIQDEYLARAEYDAIMDQYGNIRPFTNIIKAETSHIQSLTTLFNTYKIALPKDQAADLVQLPATLANTYQAGVDAEITNIDMYEAFLDQKLPADVRLVFEKLKSASENHLKAFQNAVSRENGKSRTVNNTYRGGR